MRKTIIGKGFLIFFFVLLIVSCADQASVSVSGKTEQSVATEKPVILEIITSDAKQVDMKKLRQVLESNFVDQQAVYQWKNHVVVFDRIQQPLELRIKILASFPGAQVKVYEHPFYVFDRTHCDSSGVAKEWDHVILTANLVSNTRLQKEYLDYHATQFQKWPEVAKGFCNARFQQLLLYKNDRQLMLVISIPKGESLDELNPRTTENNPRVNEWNALMKNYQEGIAGAAKDEVWVFLKQVPLR